MRGGGGVRSILEVQNKRISLSSFVQDFYPIIYNSGQLSFTTAPFPKVWQNLVSIQVSHDIWTYYMFKQLTWHACQEHRVIITRKSSIPLFIKREQMFARSKRPALICKNTSCGGDPLSGGVPTKVRKKINFIPVECHFFSFSSRDRTRILQIHGNVVTSQQAGYLATNDS